MPNDVVVVDLDTNIITIPDELTIPDLPEPDTGILKVGYNQSAMKH